MWWNSRPAISSRLLIRPSASCSSISLSGVSPLDSHRPRCACRCASAKCLRYWRCAKVTGCCFHARYWSSDTPWTRRGGGGFAAKGDVVIEGLDLGAENVELRGHPLHHRAGGGGVGVGERLDGCGVVGDGLRLADDASGAGFLLLDLDLGGLEEGCRGGRRIRLQDAVNVGHLGRGEDPAPHLDAVAERIVLPFQ